MVACALAFDDFQVRFQIRGTSEISNLEPLDYPARACAAVLHPLLIILLEFITMYVDLDAAMKRLARSRDMCSFMLSASLMCELMSLYASFEPLGWRPIGGREEGGSREG
ncbi:hypothetical protein CRG98_032182 [Punica granatum]|uniref:Uncharacterized protein n=1 Tax=Punica granatum TaxID=22663 RepID=A0A2I0IVJ8_PUNGR|nr:hypothetical protein CRG98_032182 [Punica granatum]